MNNLAPKVSVILPVYNREKYVADAVKSILNQSYTSFEFIIIDDGSTDSTFDILKSFNDKRIKLVRKNKNKGNYSARNEGMELATGKYICVMDSDDIALPNRIQRQFEFMEQHKQFGICGSFAKVIDSDEIITAPEDYDEIKVWSMSNIMFRHPTVFIRAEFLKKYNLKYNDYYRYAGDYDFLVKAAHLFPVTNIQEVLLEYRRHPEQISTANNSEQVKVAYSVMLNQLTFFIENANDVEKQLHLALMNRFPIKDESDFKQLREWANFLQERNNQTGYYHQAHLANFLKSLLKYIFKQYEISKKEYRISSLLKTQKLVDFGRFKCEIQKINEIIKPKISLKFDKEWAVLPDFILKLINLITDIKPLTIVECGSGLSTLICGYLTKNNMVNHVFSLEHNKQYYETTRMELQSHGLDKYVTLIYAPLKKIKIKSKYWLWYDLTDYYASFGLIDMLLVDGPPGFVQKHARYPAIPVLKKFFNQNTTVILDDSTRLDELTIIERWLIENPSLSSSQLETIKGMCILRQKQLFTNH